MIGHAFAHGERAAAAPHGGRRPAPPTNRPAITSPEVAGDLLVPLMQHLDREHGITSTSTRNTGSSPEEIVADPATPGESAFALLRA